MLGTSSGILYRLSISACHQLGARQYWPGLCPEPSISSLIPVAPKSSVGACIRAGKDRNHLEQRKVDTAKAIVRLLFVIRLGPDACDVGRQLSSSEGQEEEAIMMSIVGVRSPQTILKRCGALLAFYRWHAANREDPFLPISEESLWSYVLSLSQTGAAATKASAAVQAVRFAHFVLGADGALEAATSRRIVGNAELQLSRKAPTKQARPLTIGEVCVLHSIADDATRPALDRVCASNLLLMLYGRCRNSDVAHIEEVLHDQSEAGGFIELRTRCHKGARSAQQKAMLLLS